MTDDYTSLWPANDAELAAWRSFYVAALMGSVGAGEEGCGDYQTPSVFHARFAADVADRALEQYRARLLHAGTK